jgi:hypothetical protein
MRTSAERHVNSQERNPTEFPKAAIFNPLAEREPDFSGTEKSLCMLKGVQYPCIARPNGHNLGNVMPLVKIGLFAGIIASKPCEHRTNDNGTSENVLSRYSRASRCVIVVAKPDDAL